MWLLSVPTHMCVFLYARLHACVFQSSIRTNICVCYSPLEVLILCHLAARGDAAHLPPHLMTALPQCPPLYTPPHLHSPNLLLALFLFFNSSDLHLRAFLSVAKYTHRGSKFTFDHTCKCKWIEKNYRP